MTVITSNLGYYGVSLLISKDVGQRLQQPQRYQIRLLERASRAKKLLNQTAKHRDWDC
jgi:hypothetical protein